jgi:hypothetical protein
MDANDVCKKILYGDDVEYEDADNVEVIDVEGNVVEEE